MREETGCGAGGRAWGSRAGGSAWGGWLRARGWRFGARRSAVGCLCRGSRPVGRGRGRGRGGPCRRSGRVAPGHGPDPCRLRGLDRRHGLCLMARRGLCTVCLASDRVIWSGILCGLDCRGRGRGRGAVCRGPCRPTSGGCWAAGRGASRSWLKPARCCACVCCLR